MFLTIRRPAAFALMVAVVLFGASAFRAYAADRYVDANGICGGNSPCYTHPQDAVNAANPGDTILVYPGTYGSRFSECPWKPNCSCSDQYAPAVIVYKDGITLKSVSGPANTTIQSTHACWSNAGPVERSTNGGVNGIGGWSPNTIVVVANNARIDGFTLHRPFNCANTNDCFWNTAGVFIGSKGAGYQDFLGKANGATVTNNVFSDVWHAVYIWHSADNKVTGNTVQALGNTGHWAAIESYDGWDDASATLQPQSKNNVFENNAMADKGIGIGAWAPPTWTDNSGNVVACNTGTSFGAFYSTGYKRFVLNSVPAWSQDVSGFLSLKSIAYAGPTEATVDSACKANVTLAAKLVYDAVGADASGIAVSINAQDASTGTDGSAGVQASFSPGTYTIPVALKDWTCTGSSATGILKVVDASAPEMSEPTATPVLLWPPNQRMVPVTVSASASDNCGAECRITAVTTNEPAAGDAVITGSTTVNLRAERNGSGSGRVYGIVITCTDAAGNSTSKTVNVTVPHDQGKR